MRNSKKSFILKEKLLDFIGMAMIMVDYREILRLQSLGHNIIQISESLHSSRNTVREVERLADEKGIR